MSILVLGATGNVGPHVVCELSALGETPRVLVRDAERARDLSRRRRRGASPAT